MKEMKDHPHNTIPQEVYGHHHHHHHHHHPPKSFSVEEDPGSWGCVPQRVNQQAAHRHLKDWPPVVKLHILLFCNFNKCNFFLYFENWISYLFFVFSIFAFRIFFICVSCILYFINFILYFGSIFSNCKTWRRIWKEGPDCLTTRLMMISVRKERKRAMATNEAMLVIPEYSEHKMTPTNLHQN